MVFSTVSSIVLMLVTVLLPWFAEYTFCEFGSSANATGTAAGFGAGNGLPANAGSTATSAITASVLALMTATVPFPEFAAYIRPFSVVLRNTGRDATQPLPLQSCGKLIVVAEVPVEFVLAETVSSPLLAT
jgi:hypothetical protein